MSKGNVKATPTEPLGVGYNNWAFQYILREQYDRLKARLLNLVESGSRSDEQCKALKGLVKDFTNQAYYDSLRNMENYLRYFKVIAEGEGQSDYPRLENNSINDFLVQ